VHVDAVQQRPGELALIFVAAQLRVVTAFRRLVGVAAGARVQCGNQLKIGRVRDLLSGPGKRDLAAFQRFPQYFQYFAGELGQLIQKQDAVVCQGNFTGFGVAATVNSI